MDTCSFYDIPCWLGWLIVELKLIAVSIWESMLTGFLAVVAAIPVPDFLDGMSSIQIPAGVAYFAEAFALQEGAAMIVGAYILRFIVRRIPVIG